MCKGTILIIEDNELNLDLAKELLEEVGFETMGAENADTGIHMAQQYQPNLILMDMHLPLKNGYEASQALKADVKTRDIPIVAFTALARKEEKQKAMDHGCSGLISKPIDVDHFAEAVSAFFLHPIDVSHSFPLPLTTKILPFPDKASSVSEHQLQAFLMNLSHDLQAPIRKVKQLGCMLRKSAKETLSPEDCDLWDRLEHSTQQMENVLSHTLTEFHKSRE